MPSVVVDSLRVRYGDLVAVDGVSFSADAGEVTVLLGPNGAGKTSTIETIEGYRRSDAGTVRVLGLDPIEQHRALTQRMGVMLQEGGVHPAMRPGEAVRLYASYYDDALDPVALLDRVGLTARAATPVRRLSGGEQRRVSLALALVGRPSVALLDEPTAGVDIEGRQVIRRIVRELCDEGVCVVLTTHDLAEAEKVADRIVIIDDGKLVADGSVDELLRAGPEQRLRFAAAPGLATDALGLDVGARVTETSAGDYVVDAEPTPQLVAAVTAWFAAHDLSIGELRTRQSLEDVFVRLTGDATENTRRDEDPRA